MAMRAVDLRHVRMAAMALSLRLETRIITAKNTAIQPMGTRSVSDDIGPIVLIKSAVDRFASA
jgi:hypothetical protein